MPELTWPSYLLFYAPLLALVSLAYPAALLVAALLTSAPEES
jgi:hypothetical protein